MTDPASGTSRDVTRQLGYLLRQAQANVWRDLIATFEPFGVRPQQYAALVRIEQAPDTTLESVAQVLGIRPPNLVALIEDLVARGLVGRRKLPSDRRVNALYLTPAGAVLLEELKAADDRHERALVDELGETRLRLLSEDLRQLASFSSSAREEHRSRRA